MSADPEVRVMLCGREHARTVPAPRRLRWATANTSRAGHILLAPDAAADRLGAARLQRLSLSYGPDRAVDSQELARAIAVLGEEAQLRHAAALARLSLDAAASAADQLARRGMLMPGTPLRFVDRTAHAAVYDAIPVVLRGVRHAEAARMLADEGAEPEIVCSHLLAAEATGSLDVVSRLRAAAARAQSRGKAELAIRYLTRALDETADANTRRRVRHELGQAARVVRARDAAEQMRLALGVCEDRDERAATANDLSEVLLFAGARDAARRAMDEAMPDEPARVVLDAYDTRWVEQFDRRVERLITTARDGGCSALSGALSGVLAWRGEPAEVVRALLARADDDPPHATWREAHALSLGQAVLAHAFLEDLGPAWSLIDELRSVACSRGSVGAAAVADACAAVLHARAGALPDAEAELRALAALDDAHAVALVVPLALCLAADALLERPDLGAALAPVAAREVADESVEGAMLHELRGRLALERGDASDARRELEAATATYDALRLCSSCTSSWRCALALAVGLGGDDHERATQLAGAELADAGRSQSPRAIGTALRTLGLLESGARAIGFLEDAVAVLEPSAARLEHARALVDLGAALRRANRRSAARGPLRAGLESAELCGAVRLRERALVELHATGARPRRLMLSGPASLTTAERRVAEMAIAGFTNPEIAQALFVTINTVEGHLRHVYQKLSIHSRRQLPDALRDDLAA